MLKGTAIILIAAGVFVGINGFFSGQPATSDCALTVKPREFQYEPYYTGQLMDAHLHMPVSSGIVSIVASRIGLTAPLFSGSLNPDYLTCLFKAEGISKTFGFFMTTKFSSWQELASVKKFEKNYPGRIAPFYMPAPYSWIQVDASAMRKTLDKNKGLFKGIGEIKDFENIGLDNPYFMDLFKIASDYNLAVMMHPFPNHKPAVEKILKMYPKVKFLLHGGEKEIEEWITSLMKNYSNVYYSLDADIISLYGWGNPKGEIKYNPTKEEWLAYIRENFDSVLGESVRAWKSKIEAYPDRFMWGTDRWYNWHFDQEAGRLQEEFGRSFIGKLAPSVREKFAYKNAQKFIDGAGK